MSNPFGELIASGEGGYNSYNRGTQGNKIIPANQEVDFARTTIAEIQRRQSLSKSDPDVLFAVGRYQLIPGTLDEAVSKLNIDTSEKFTPEMQDRLFGEGLIREKRPEIYEYVTGVSGATLHDAQKAASKEWASVEDPDTPGHAYAKYERMGNRMSITAAQVADAIDEMKLEYKAGIDKGLSAEGAWQATLSMGPGQFGPIAKGHIQHQRGATSHVLREGDDNPSVGELQTHLRDLGYTDLQGNPLKTDNKFGASTRGAVEAFQRDHGLRSDGVAGDHTLRAIDGQRALLGVVPAFAPALEGRDAGRAKEPNFASSIHASTLQDAMAETNLAQSITKHSSVHDMFEAICQAAANKDMDALCAVGRAYENSPAGQASLAQGAELNRQQAHAQALAEQHAQAQVHHTQQQAGRSR
ncbi:peptidoglycan-binding protein [Dyella dinghuensis]|uniref:Peptidoglycan-binding protein n=1 Tax=Dyella dinghuensis TaxID=1920169 RepID=A0A432LYY4_9GAMM|nr:peptidoglycan-binding protein [Dyella dinghuensis]RUL67098.1 peptidoglycan-binding protein [Dyella dinghuensis]